MWYGLPRPRGFEVEAICSDLVGFQISSKAVRHCQGIVGHLYSHFKYVTLATKHTYSYDKQSLHKQT